MSPNATDHKPPRQFQIIGGTRWDRNPNTIEKIKNGFATLPWRRPPVYSRVSQYWRFVRYKFAVMLFMKRGFMSIVAWLDDKE